MILLALSAHADDEQPLLGDGPPIASIAGRGVGDASAAFADEFDTLNFFRGNIHTHSNERKGMTYEDGKGDGDASPETIFQAYENLGYSFISLTEHNFLSAARGLVKNIPGIELTSNGGHRTESKPVHVNALCVRQEVKGLRGENSASTLRETVRRARSAGAKLVVVNHPNWAGALTSEDLLGVEGFNGIEVASGHGKAMKDDAAAAKSAEQMWEDLLEAGREVFAVAADDAHNYGDKGEARPGKAWIETWGGGSICEQLRTGRFVASTGPRLASLKVKGNRIDINVVDPWNPKKDKIEFLRRRDQNGENLAAVRTTPVASYELKGGEGWIRVRVTQGDKRLWTQPFRVK
jgi:hypothetical protein